MRTSSHELIHAKTASLSLCTLWLLTGDFLHSVVLQQVSIRAAAFDADVSCYPLKPPKMSRHFQCGPLNIDPFLILLKLASGDILSLDDASHSGSVQLYPWRDPCNHIKMPLGSHCTCLCSGRGCCDARCFPVFCCYRRNLVQYSHLSSVWFICLFGKYVYFRILTVHSIHAQSLCPSKG